MNTRVNGMIDNEFVNISGSRQGHYIVIRTKNPAPNTLLDMFAEDFEKLITGGHVIDIFCNILKNRMAVIVDDNHDVDVIIGIIEQFLK